MPSKNKRRTATQRRYGYHITPVQIRRVWAELTATPHVSLREIACRAQLQTSCVRACRDALRDAGYVDYDDGAVGTTTILIPFHVMHKN